MIEGLYLRVTLDLPFVEKLDSPSLDLPFVEKLDFSF